MPRSAQRASLLVVAVLGLACATNPVTGKSEIVLRSESWEIAIGERRYAQARQASGGDYTIDPSDPDYYFNPGSLSVEITDQGGIDCQQQTFPAAQTNLTGCDFDATATAVGLALYQGGSDPRTSTFGGI